LVERPPIIQPDAAIPAKPDHQLKPEEVKAVDTVFSQDPDKLTTLSMMGLWSAAMLVGDWAREHQKRVEEDEEKEAEVPFGPPKD
jgi:hypothetical protein